MLICFEPSSLIFLENLGKMAKFLEICKISVKKKLEVTIKNELVVYNLLIIIHSVKEFQSKMKPEDTK